jgi:hypothetical protein
MARGDGHDATTPGGCLFVVLQLCLIRISAFPQFPRLLQADDDRRQPEEADIGRRNDERDQRGHYAGAVECSDTDILADDDLADADLGSAKKPSRTNTSSTVGRREQDYGDANEPDRMFHCR